MTLIVIESSRAVTANGPAYPAHFDGEPLVIGESFEEIDADEAIAWKAWPTG